MNGVRPVDIEVSSTLSSFRGVLKSGRDEVSGKTRWVVTNRIELTTPSTPRESTNRHSKTIVGLTSQIKDHVCRDRSPKRNVMTSERAQPRESYGNDDDAVRELAIA